MDHRDRYFYQPNFQYGGFAAPQPGGGMGQTMAAGYDHHGQYAAYPSHPGYPAYPPNGAYPAYGAQYQQSSSLLPSDRFLKGLLIGAAATYLLTNESVQRSVIKGTVKAWSLLQGGVEELKERFHDAEAEVRAESAE